MNNKKVFFGGINVPFRNGINVPAALFYRLRNGKNMPSLGKRGFFTIYFRYTKINAFYINNDHTYNDY